MYSVGDCCWYEIMAIYNKQGARVYSLHIFFIKEIYSLKNPHSKEFIYQSEINEKKEYLCKEVLSRSDWDAEELLKIRLEK